MKIFTPTEFTDLIASMQEHTYHLPHDPENTPLRSHKFSVARQAHDRFYLLNGSKIYDLVAVALKKKFPQLDDMDVTMFCNGIPAYLQSPCVIVEYIEDKEDRDYFIQKVITPTERELLESSITRASNMATILRTIEAVFYDYPDEKKYFAGFEEDIKKKHTNQSHQRNDLLKLVNAKKARQIVYDFCIKLINENS